ncbi:MAG TPA: tetratricopeptide repeat protein [Stellaceae bacterium]|jgi:Tfp pilus assembly protein PilF|nr:tetratricopeptide repeat protein [Stellaceae bacterium]
MASPAFGSALLLVHLLRDAAPVRENVALTHALARLRTVTDAEEADRLDTTIWRLWCAAGTLRAVRELTTALQCMAADDMGNALSALDKAIAADPDFAEAWNRRAMVHFLNGDNELAARDIARVLLLEPRHYGALSGLGQVLLQEGDRAGALTAFEAAMAYNPHLPSLRAIVERLRVAGPDGRSSRSLLT